MADGYGDGINEENEGVGPFGARGWTYLEFVKEVGFVEQHDAHGDGLRGAAKAVHVEADAVH